MRLSRFLAALLLIAPVALADAPTIDPADDAKHFGSPERALFWTPEEKVAGFRNMDRLFPTRIVATGEDSFPLPSTFSALGAVEIQDGERALTVDEYFKRQNVAGLLVIHDGRVVYERYGLGNSGDTRWVSFSVTKSVVSMLVGAAVRDGYIESIDERVTAYLPRLAGSAYDDVTIRHLLQMASGVEWNEDYADPESDVNSMPRDAVGMYRYMGKKNRVAKPGEAFNYNTAESQIVGALVRAAIGNNLSTYLSNKIWRPFGMESDAVWLLTEEGGGETGGCCISATLRDYGLIGLFALRGGRLADGTAVLPDDWMRRSTEPSPASERYGYLWWLGEGGAYSAIGIFGQGIHIDPEQNVVIALQSAREVASQADDWSLQGALFEAITAALRD
ncbi:MAG: serine hydrolase [Acidobacteria bacterium]|nr:serine hydrolase [Acidobacteriota bacterium]NIM64098.1 serine hydrolase [Acidobacteriota bacterium]NIO59398.1 serine hydrolase [Acidobacteriota bacterium]NIQ30432.1 serine hydrolase [Acidobacteriota bacterium]NIQ85364.1 serine hydrolase [Acidobacteriota bacterium]